MYYEVIDKKEVVIFEGCGGEFLIVEMFGEDMCRDIYFIVDYVDKYCWKC